MCVALSAQEAGNVVPAKGSPLTSIMSRCPSCEGRQKEINAEMAKAGLVDASNALYKSLRLAISCESTYEKALLERDPYKQLDALNGCLASHATAFNLDVVRDVKNELEKDVVEFKKLRETEEAARTAKIAQQENQKQQQEDILVAIQSSKAPRVALEQIRAFIADNPESSVMVKAKLILAETTQRVADEQKIAQRNRYIFFGVVALVVLAIIAWLINCINFTKKVQITKIELVPPTRWPAPLEKKKIPFNPRNGAARTTPLSLQPATASTSKENYVECPECGALLECPFSFHDTVVLCASCQKAFSIV